MNNLTRYLNPSVTSDGKPGKRKVKHGTKRFLIHMDESFDDKAREMGDGNMSKGVRVALLNYEEK